jgi:hypothetical protein
MRCAFRYGAATVLLVAVFVPGFAASAADETDEADVLLRQKRLEFLLEQTDKLQLDVADDASRRLKRGDQPILRWSNPVRDFVNDGVTFLFFEGERPRALASVWVRGREASLTKGEIWRELISFSSEPLSCRRDGEVLWSPKTGGLVDQMLADAPRPASRRSQRLVQMRELAHRFRAASYKPDAPNELRLLNQPLYRYPHETADTLDGGLFGFTEGNDPEVFLLLEAVAVDNGQRHEWRYTLARSTGYRVTVDLDGRQVFSVEPFWSTPQSLESPYVTESDGPFVLDTSTGER